MKMLRVFALLLLGLLAGCGSSDSSSFMINGSGNALTLIRSKAFAWDDRWEQALVVSRHPDCQRRHPLKDAPDGKFKLEVYQAGEGGWILHQGNRWYVAETGQCQLQQFKEPPPEPGQLVGAFVEKTGVLKFVTEAVKPAAPSEETPAK